MAESQAGQPAVKVGKWERIGPEECPLLWRRTLASNRFFKVLYHRFVADATDRDFHDHPRSFVTFVLRGGYEDVSLCLLCKGRGYSVLFGLALDVHETCPECGGSGKHVEQVRAPMIRVRHATHSHITHVGPRGATTLVVMGPFRRDWGFWRGGRWFGWRVYERTFGMGFRCATDEDRGQAHDREP